MPASAEITPIPNGTVTSAQGFSAGGVFIGLKTRGEDKLDLALLVSDSECSIGGVFTTSAIRSATVDLDRERVARGRGRALIVNAGIANTCVGAQGYKDAEEMTRLAAEKLGLTAEDVLVCSTGVIGVELPMSLIRSGVDRDRAEGRRRAGTGARHDDHRHASERNRRILRCVHRPDHHRGWRGQGFRHDPSEHGHHADLHRHRRGR